VSALLYQINYIGAAALFSIGLYMVLIHGNLVRKIIGINLMETAVFLVFVTIGYVRGARAPVIAEINALETAAAYVNPLPSALILTGIVVAVSITVYALSLVLRIHRLFGTIEMEEILLIRERESGE
jgi:multicomponent Na+:H+ antiporter subunit C